MPRKIAVQVGIDLYMIVSAESAEPLIFMLANANLYSRNDDYRNPARFKKTGKSPTIEFVSPEQIEHETIAEMAAAAIENSTKEA